MNQVIIMAQGYQRRLACLQSHKCLLPIGGGATLLSRTVKLLGNTNHDWLVVGWPDLSTICRKLEVGFVTLPQPGLCILEGLAQVSRYFSREDHRCRSPGRTTILLGDVLYSHAAMSAIMSDRRSLVFAGTRDISRSTGEIFALSFTDHCYVAQLLENSKCRPAHAKTDVPQPGHLRNLLWDVLPRRDFPCSPPRDVLKPVYLEIDDYTTDFDTEADLARLPSAIASMRSEV
jgi:hypothetical protein